MEGDIISGGVVSSTRSLFSTSISCSLLLVVSESLCLLLKLARETPTASYDDDGCGSVNSDDVSDTASLSSMSSSSSSLRLSPDSTSLYDVSLVSTVLASWIVSK